MFDYCGWIINWNFGVQWIKGYLLEEVIGWYFFCFYIFEDCEVGELVCGLVVVECEGCFEKEGWWVCKDGSCFWVNVVIDLICDSDGWLIGFVKVICDIIYWIEVECELEWVCQELFQVQKMEFLGYFIGGVVYDFNNLLMVIIGSFGLLKKCLFGDQCIVDFLQNVLEVVQCGVNLIQWMFFFVCK